MIKNGLFDWARDKNRRFLLRRKQETINALWCESGTKLIIEELIRCLDGTLYRKISCGCKILSGAYNYSDVVTYWFYVNRDDNQFLECEIRIKQGENKIFEIAEHKGIVNSRFNTDARFVNCGLDDIDKMVEKHYNYKKIFDFLYGIHKQC